MTDSSAAGIGLVFAGLALASTFLPWAGPPVATLPGVGELWTPIGAALAAFSLLAFALRRYDVVERRPGALAAAAASLAVVGYATAVVISSVGEQVGVGIAVAFVAGLGGLTMAYLDWRAVGRKRLSGMAVRAGISLAIGAVGLFVGNLFGVLPDLLIPDLSAPLRILLSTPLFGLGLGLAALGFLNATDRGFTYLDFEMPDRFDAAYMLGGTVAILVLLVALGVLADSLGLPSAENSLVRQAQGNPAILLVLVPLSWLVIGPGEELLFRNVVQKYLYESFSREGAIVVACAIFALMHVPAYYTADPIALFSTLVRLFFLSLILGVAYARTDNIIVPIVIHGTFNAVQFALLYAMIEWNIDDIVAVS